MGEHQDSQKSFIFSESVKKRRSRHCKNVEKSIKKSKGQSIANLARAGEVHEGHGHRITALPLFSEDEPRCFGLAHYATAPPLEDGIRSKLTNMGYGVLENPRSQLASYEGHLAN